MKLACFGLGVRVFVIGSIALEMTLCAAAPEPGTLNSLFDVTQKGYWAGFIGYGSYDVKQMLVTPRQQVVLGGNFYSVNGLDRKHLVAVGPNGALNLGFKAPFVSWGSVSAIANYPGGRLMVAGTFSLSNEPASPYLIRLNSDGSLDTSFRAKGVQGRDPIAVTVDSDGRIVASFGASYGVPAGPPLVRFQSNGDLDSSLQTGYVTGSNYPVITAIRLCPDGKILVGGYFDAPTVSILRMNSDGSFDNAFDAHLRHGTLRPSVRSIELQADGKVLIGGVFTSVNGTPCTNLARLNGDGTFDGSFQSHACDGGIDAIAIQPDQKVITAGTFTFFDGKTNLPGLVRMLSTGAIDSSFDLAPLRAACSCQEMVQVTLDASNRILVCGALGGDYRVPGNMIYCMETNGVLDTNFSKVVGASWALPMSVEAQSDGSIFVAGEFTGVQDRRCNGFVRITRDGNVMPGYSIPDGYQGEGSVSLTQPDGCVLVAGSWINDDNLSYSVFRYKPDGTLDPDWFYNRHATNAMSVIHDMAVTSDGKILVCGLDPQWDTAVQRLLPNGTIDPSFHPPLIWGSDDIGAERMAVQPDGRILVCGEITSVNEQPTANMIRLFADGSFDAAFSAATRSVADMVPLANGKILVAGWHLSSDESRLECLRRLNPDGSLDSTFSIPHDLDGPGYQVRVQPNGKIIVVGPIKVGQGSAPKTILRFLPDGGIDPDFVQGQADDMIRDLDLTADGSIIVVGNLNRYNGASAPGFVSLNGDPVTAPLATRTLPGVALSGSLVHVFIDLHLPESFGSFALEDKPALSNAVVTVSNGGAVDPITGKVKFGPFFTPPATPLSYDIFVPTNVIGPVIFSGTASIDGTVEAVAGPTQMGIADKHPGDCSPADFSFSIAEVTAYAGAWKQGRTWPAGPNPIPQNYVSRAGYLWRAGEQYIVELSAGEAPLFWVPTLPVPHVQMLYDEVAESSATRTAAPGYVEGLPVPIRITVKPPLGTLAYTAEEVVPTNWTVTVTGSDGSFDAVNGCVKWGPFFDSAARILEYQVVPGAFSSSRQQLYGMVSFDGNNALIAGAAVIRQSCRLRRANLLVDGTMVLETQGLGSSTPVVEMSEDLIHWNGVPVLSCVDGKIQVPCETSNAGNRFYRVRLD